MIGDVLGPYRVLEKLGAGGMGDVYRARDTKLDREVAIKVLPAAFVSDSERVARFQREARTLASLNHPNIGAIYGLEERDGRAALVLELVEGPTLADRIAHGPIPLDDALPIAKQIAEALEAAHEQGIVHRDLKPANIKLRPDGTVKVLDFGLAKALAPASSAVTASPTITSPAMTRAGMILGTAAYMSPEQAKGRDADKRSDLWAFGCVLYEMLTGRSPFGAEGVSETLARVIEREPDFSLLPRPTPPSIVRLVRRALVKEPRMRLPDIAVARIEIQDATTEPPALSSVTPQPRSARWRTALPWAAAALVLAGIVGAAVWFATRPIPPRVARFSLTTASADALSINAIDRDLAITPDGSRVVYVGGGGARS